MENAVQSTADAPSNAQKDILLVDLLCIIVRRILVAMRKQLAANKRNKSAAVADSVIKSIEALKREDIEPTFNNILACLRSRNILSNHRSLRLYLDAMVCSGLLSIHKEPAKQPNVRPKQVYSLTGHGPFVEAGVQSMLFHGLNWTVPSRPSIKMKTDTEGLARGRIALRTVYGSLEDTVVETLAKNKNKDRLYQILTFCAALLATKKFDQDYLMHRAERKKVGDLVQGLLAEIEYVLESPKPEVEDVRTLYLIRERIPHRRPTPTNYTAQRFPLLPDEVVDAIGKQLGVQ